MHRPGRQLEFEGADEAGLLISSICLVHCLAVPALLMLLPAVGTVFADPTVHQLLAVLAMLTVGLALVPSTLRHRRWGIAVCGLAGALLVFFAAFGLSNACCSVLLALTSGGARLTELSAGGWLTLAATPLGCLLIAAAHVWNLRQRGHRRSGWAVCPLEHPVL